MKISDITLGKSVLENLIDKKKDRPVSSSSRLTEHLNARGDSFDPERRVHHDMARMSELQKNFARNSAGLQGLVSMKKMVDEHDRLPALDRNYQKLTQELSAIVASTKYQGENVISYLSTQVRDEKSLYTLKNGLDSEIRNVQLKMSAERKDIASYLVREENLASVSAGISPDRNLETVRRRMQDADVAGPLETLHRNIPKISALLG